MDGQPHVWKVVKKPREVDKEPFQKANQSTEQWQHSRVGLNLIISCSPLFQPLPVGRWNFYASADTGW